ncbi:MBL fold metallo-hydrolase [Paeniglutamicibacter sp. NPDC091659]|uniref:MBL fold metallo-hydrolase n=1 Tax=Paeniglutamicibacter sp. NPDC091659 TaxID=3364389 RepID=UPI0037F8C288
MSTNSSTGMTVYTLGTGGGPIVSSSRAGTSTAICVEGATYVIDCGMGSIRNYREHSNWGQLRGIFLTHHHSDHIYDLGSYLVTGWQVPGESFSSPIQVFGPGRPERIPALDHVHAAEIDARLGNRAMTSTTEIVDALLDRVFASDIAIRMADEARGEPHDWVLAHDISIPAGAGAHPVTNRHPEMEPFEVYRDELVRITAILVDHRLCFPAFAYRVDSAYGSVVISGDTAYSENCISLARGADLLLHEVIDLPSILATFPEGPTRDGIEVHLRESHTPFETVGKVAENAGVKTLVLHHIVPNTPGTADLAAMEKAARRDFSGPVHIASDNDSFHIGGAKTPGTGYFATIAESMEARA